MTLVTKQFILSIVEADKLQAMSDLDMANLILTKLPDANSLRDLNKIELHRKEQNRYKLLVEYFTDEKLYIL